MTIYVLRTELDGVVTYLDGRRDLDALEARRYTLAEAEKRAQEWRSALQQDVEVVPLDGDGNPYDPQLPLFGLPPVPPKVTTMPLERCPCGWPRLHGDCIGSGKAIEHCVEDKAERLYRSSVPIPAEEATNDFVRRHVMGLRRRWRQQQEASR